MYFVTIVTESCCLTTRQFLPCVNSLCVFTFRVIAMSKFANSRYPLLEFAMSDPAFHRISILVFPFSYSRTRDFRIRIFAIADFAIYRFLVFRSRDLWLYFCSRSREFAMSRDQNPRFAIPLPQLRNSDSLVSRIPIPRFRIIGFCYVAALIPRFRYFRSHTSAIPLPRNRDFRLRDFATHVCVFSLYRIYSIS